MLALMQKQLPVQFRFDRDELKRLVETAGQLAGDCAGEAGLHDTAASLAALREETAKTLAGCSVDPAALHADVVRLREAIGELVTRAGESASPAVMQRVQQRVIEMSREQTLRDRSLMAPQGWEAGLPAIETLLDGSRHP